MSMRREWLFVGGATALLLAGALVTMNALAPDAPHAEVGARAPDFAAPLVPSRPAGTEGSAPLPDGAVRTLADYEGDVILLNFWATWCEPCKVEMPSMEAVHRDYAPFGLRVVAVSEDDARITPSDLRAYAEDLELTFEILRDTSHAISHAYQVIGYPTTYIIARDGTVRRRWIGPEDWNSPSNRAFMRQLLGIERDGDG
jgi:cytochrome c biogenesis protein CcmG, thiol:disulfide interchange protein DsbE